MRGEGLSRRWIAMGAVGRGSTFRVEGLGEDSDGCGRQGLNAQG